MSWAGKNFLTFGLGAISGSTLTIFYKYFLEIDQAGKLSVESDAENLTHKSAHKKIHRSWNYESYKPNYQWDYNWDNRANMAKIETLNENGETVTKRQKANRHILLIRHGQYNLKGTTDEERALTDLGMMQAECSGRRLAELNLPLTSLISSTMTRAIQTADIVRKHLPKDITVLSPDVLLREGSPYPPEPISRWHPELHFHDDGARIEAAFRKYFHRAEPTQVERQVHLVNYRLNKRTKILASFSTIWC